MAAVEEQCCAPGVLGRLGNTGQQQGTTGYVNLIVMLTWVAGIIYYQWVRHRIG